MAHNVLLVALGRTLYGIRTEDVLAVEEGIVHQLPPDDTYITAAFVRKSRIVYLADLSLCMGFSPCGKSTESHLLLMSEKSPVGGFVYSGEIEDTTVPATSLFSLPSCVESELIDAFIEHDSRAVPVINVRVLYKKIQSKDRLPAQLSFSVPSAAPVDSPAKNGLRMFGWCGRLYAVSANIVEEKPVKDVKVTSMPGLAQELRGIAIHERRVLPVISLPSTDETAGREMHTEALVGNINGQDIGLLVDKDRGLISTEKTSTRSLPPLVQSSWLQDAVSFQKRLALVLDLASFAARNTESVHEKAISERYALDSETSSNFRKTDLEILEFSLLGMTHALPRAEVEDSVSALPFHGIFDEQGILLGVAEYSGNLVPVLDLAACYGMRSAVTAEWQMMLVRNGSFEALVAVEKVLGDVTLEIDKQKELPVTLHYPVVYGCYTSADEVRLIFNSAALAIYFEAINKKPYFPFPTDVGQIASEKDDVLQHFEESAPRASKEAKTEVLETQSEISKKETGKLKSEPPVVSEQQETGPEPEESMDRRIEELEPVEENARRETPSQEAEQRNTEAEADVQVAEEQRRAATDGAASKRRRRRYLSAILVPAIVAASYFAVQYGMSSRDGVENAPSSTSPDQNAAVSPAQVDESVSIEPPASQPSLESTPGITQNVEENLGAGVSADYLIYTVKEGDNLFNISIEFTGSGFNYPKIAEDSGIETPRLIYPGQKVNVQKKW
jgi:chemotaxis signal transduction protein/nucleoid-associated protein YgaU